MTTHTDSSRTHGASVKNLPALEQEPSLVGRVLVVEDHEDTRFMLKTMLEMRGLSVVEATDGEAAIAAAERERPDLILMDSNLPLLDGLAATRRIRQSASPARAVPIIFLSGHAQPAAQAAAFAAGCDDYLVKPFDFDEMDRTLARHLLQWRSGLAIAI